MSIDLEYPLTLKNFGLFHLNVKEAATLITKLQYLDDGLFHDVVNYEHKEDCSPLYDPELEKILDAAVKMNEELLINGIGKGTLKSEYIRRLYNDKIIPEETFLEIDVLLKWLDERNIGIGGEFGIGGDWYQQYINDENEVAVAMAATMETERAKVRNRKLYEEYTRTHENDEAFGLITRIQELEAELESIRSRKSAKPEKPVSTRERETLLKIVIGMAMKKYHFDPQKSKNSATINIMKDLEELGIPVSDDTILDKLKEAVEFLPQEAVKA